MYKRQEELSKLTNLVREAMGYSESRGDSLNLVNSQFNDGPPALPMWRDPEMISLFKTILAWLVGGVLALWLYRKAVSYTHLDVYKRQTLPSCVSLANTTVSRVASLNSTRLG